MIWAIGVALVVAGALLIILAMQDKWPIAPIKIDLAAPVEPVGPHPGEKPPEPISR